MTATDTPPYTNKSISTGREEGVVGTDESAIMGENPNISGLLDTFIFVTFDLKCYLETVAHSLISLGYWFLYLV